MKDLDAILKKADLSKDELFCLSTLGRYDLSGKTRSGEYYQREKAKSKLEKIGYGELWFVARCRKQLYDLIKYRTNTGEIVEIYTEFVKDHEKCKFGPPENTHTIDLEEVLTSDSLRLSNRIKIEICNSG